MLKEILNEAVDYDKDYDKLEEAYRKIIQLIRKDDKKMASEIHIAWLELEDKFMKYDRKGK